MSKYISPYHPLPYPLLLGEDNDDKDGIIGHPLPRPLPLGEDKDGNDDEINNSLPDRSPPASKIEFDLHSLIAGA